MAVAGGELSDAALFGSMLRRIADVASSSRIGRAQSEADFVPFSK
jgi:hypothetical protein